MGAMQMKKISFVILTVYLCSFNASPAYARTIKFPADYVQTINNQIEVRVYAFKKTRKYTAVEIGFTNLSNRFVNFTPRDIYLDDENKYSVSLLTVEDIRSIERNKPGLSLLPLVLGIGLGIAAAATSRANSDVAFGLAMGALAMGGALLLTKGFENQARQNRLVMIENNTIDDIKRLPPGMTLGGVIYFPPTKKPKSLTIVSRTKKGIYEKTIFSLKKKKHKTYNTKH